MIDDSNETDADGAPTSDVSEMAEETEAVDAKTAMGGVATALGAALLSDGMVLTFDGEVGTLKRANEAAVFLLEVAQDGLDAYLFDDVVASDTPFDALSGGSVSQFSGALKTALSQSEVPVHVLVATVTGDDGAPEVVLHASRLPEAPAASSAPPETDVIAQITFDADGNVTDANDRAVSILEYYTSEITDVSQDKLWPTHVSQSPDYIVFWDKLREGRIMEGMYEHVTEEGTSLWLQCTYVPQRNESGALMSVTQYLMDVSDALSDAKTNAMQIDGLAAGVCFARYDTDGHGVSATKAMLTLFDIDETAFSGKKFSRFLDDEFAKSNAFKDAWAQAIRGDVAPLDIEHKTRNQRVVQTRSLLIPLRDAAGAVVEIAELAVDIDTLLRQADDLSRRYGVIENDCATAEFERNGKFISANRTYCHG